MTIRRRRQSATPICGFFLQRLAIVTVLYYHVYDASEPLLSATGRYNTGVKPMAEDFVSRDQHRADLAELTLAFKEELHGVRQDVAVLGKTTDTLAQGMGETHTKLERHSQELHGARQDVAVLGKAVEHLTQVVGDLRGQMGGMQEQIGGMQGQMGDLQGQIGDLRGQMGDLRGEMGDLRGEIGDLRGQMDGMQGQMGGMQGQINDLRGQMDRQFGDLRQEFRNLRNTTQRQMWVIVGGILLALLKIVFFPSP
jgi:chromosome segregation ATPase